MSSVFALIVTISIIPGVVYKVPTTVHLKSKIQRHCLGGKGFFPK